MVEGYTQREGVDYDIGLSPVVMHTSNYILLSMVAQFDLELEQPDVKTTFLDENLEHMLQSVIVNAEVQVHIEYILHTA